MMMKLALPLLTVPMVLMAPTGAASGQMAAPTGLSVIAPRDLTVKAGGGQLGFDDATMAQFRERVATNAEVRRSWRAVLADADTMLGQTPAAITGHPRRITEQAEPLILAYRMTGEARYAAKLRDILFMMAGVENWVTDAPLLRRDPPWNSDLQMGTTAEMFGLIYSNIRDTLSPAEREQLIASFMQRGVQPVFNDWIDGRRRIHTLDTMGHNWWAHIVFGTGAGLIGVARDAPEALRYLDRLDQAGSEWWAFAGNRLESKIATFGAQGAFSESVNYAELAVGTYLNYRIAWQETFEQAPAAIPLLPNAVDFLIHNLYPASTGPYSVNFGDGGHQKSYARTAANMWLTGDRQPRYLWYVNAFAGAGDLRRQPRYLAHLPLASEEGGKGEMPDLPTWLWDRDMGWATMRSSWAQDATMLAVRSGFTWNHNHADAGSFVLYHHGKPLLIDSGNSSYATPEYDSYYRQGIAHNVATFNGRNEPEAHTYSGSHLTGALPHMLVGGGMRYLMADATGPTSAYFERNFRHFLWLDDGVILVYDDLLAREPGQFAFQLHAEGTVQRRGTSLHVENGGARVEVRPIYPTSLPDAGLPTDYPENVRLTTLQGYKDHAPQERTTFYRFEPAELAQRQKLITAILPEEVGPAVELERLAGPNMIGVRVRAGERVTEVYMNLTADGSVKHRNSIATVMGWETDAYMVAVTYSATGTIERLLLANGSYLRRDGEVWLDSLSKRYLIGSFTGPQPEYWVQGQDNTALTLRLPGQAAQVTVNGATLHPDTGGDTIRLRCC
ncbi:heparinase II/III family protein [Croceibacterium sp. TMG7-5b_MA50]|uniref:heparinase II/III domain-containing protein n=1 Tax=Croceibacterium sp. TMG7-5b_MA50 TaxID=3121290 RepID=UPI003221686A